MKKLPLVLLLAILVSSFNPSLVLAQTPVYLDPAASVEERVNDLLGRMTLDEKIGQMTQVDHTNFYKNREDVTNCFIGSILSGGSSECGDNTTESWANMYDSLQQYALNTRLKIPMMYGIDAVHGNNNIYGATIFPHNIGLGCTRNPELVAMTARITAVEIAATGIDWNFAPCIAVPRDENWGRFYEGFGETPELAEQMGSAYTKALQGDKLSGETSILASIKHYVGDGGTQGGDDQGNVISDEKTIREIHLPGYVAAISAGAGNVMASYSSINGLKMHASKYWLTDVLKDELGFEGFIVSDWGAIDQLGPDYKQNVMTAINAGIDMVMLPRKYKQYQEDLKSLVNEGKVSMSRIDDAVSRILRKKFELGLFERPFTDRSLISKVGSKEHREVARQAVRELLVLLKNKNKALPFSKNNSRILVAGSHADNLGYQCGGWTISWMGDGGDVTVGTSILEGMKKAAPSAQIDFSVDGNFPDTKADYSLVVIGEKPYAEGGGDSLDINVSKGDIELIKRMKSYGAPVVVMLISGRPMIIENILDDSDAIIAAWLPGTEGDGVSDVLFGDFEPKGTLTHSWPRNMDQVPINVGDKNYDPLFKYGFGITSFENNSTHSD